MKIVCLGNTAQDTIEAANNRYNLTSSTSQNMVNYFNANGGNTPIKNRLIAAKDEPSFFDKMWGIFSSLNTPASVDKPVVYQAKAAPLPIPAMVGIGALAFILYKAVKPSKGRS